jgi:hypothetical protein
MMLKLTLCPAASTDGSVNPGMLMPAPFGVIAEIVTLVWP